MTPEARAKRNAYKRAWYARNKESVREYNKRYWERRAAEAKEKGQEKIETTRTDCGKWVSLDLVVSGAQAMLCAYDAGMRFDTAEAIEEWFGRLYYKVTEVYRHDAE